MNYEKLKEYRNSHNPFASLLSLVITDIQDNYAAGEICVSPDMLNPAGSVHGGCLFTLADAVGSAAASSCGMHITTVDSNFHFLRAGLGTEKLIGKAREIKCGKTLMVYDITVYDQSDTLLAEGIFTYMSLKRPIFPEGKQV